MKRVMKSLIKISAAMLFLVSSYNVYGDSCMELKANEDGTPAQYRQQRCMGNVALKNKEYFSAEEHYKKALTVDLYDKPNYYLRVELAYSLCKQGKKRAGQEVLGSFYCMANADLGNIACPKEFHGFYGQCFAIACKSYSSILSKEDKANLKKIILRASKVDNVCDGN